MLKNRRFCALVFLLVSNLSHGQEGFPTKGISLDIKFKLSLVEDKVLLQYCPDPQGFTPTCLVEVEQEKMPLNTYLDSLAVYTAKYERTDEGLRSSENDLQSAMDENDIPSQKNLLNIVESLRWVIKLKSQLNKSPSVREYLRHSLKYKLILQPFLRSLQKYKQTREGLIICKADFATTVFQFFAGDTVGRQNVTLLQSSSFLFSTEPIQGTSPENSTEFVLGIQNLFIPAIKSYHKNLVCPKGFESNPPALSDGFEGKLSCFNKVSGGAVWYLVPRVLSSTCFLSSGKEAEAEKR